MTSPTQSGLCRYFGIDRLPFSIAPDPRFLYLGQKHQEALAHLFYGIGNEGGFIVLTGEVGTGKTTLCRALLQQLPETTDVAFIVNPGLTANELLQTMCDELSLFYNAEHRTNKALLDILTRYLLVSHSRGRHTLLIIDEAQNLPVDVLEQIRLLTNLETDEKKLLQLVLIGQPELGETLASKELRQLAQRVTARYHLPTLTRRETGRYVEHRLNVSGYAGRLFSPAALRQVYRATQGTPRLINRLCDRCMLGAYVGERRDIGRHIVVQATRELQQPERQSRAQGKKRRRRDNTWRYATPALVLAGVMGVALSLAPLGLRYGGQMIAHWQQQWQLTDAAASAQQRVAQQQGKERALRDLAARWQIDVPSGEPVCQSLETAQLSCLQLELTPTQIAQLGAPGVAEVTAGSAREYHMVATASDVVSLGEVHSGLLTFWILWRQPPRTAAGWPYQPGDRHAGIPWLQQRLAWWRGEPHYWLRSEDVRDSGDAVSIGIDAEVVISNQFDWLLSQSPLLVNRSQGIGYGSAVEEEIKALQQALGWTATGVADLLTLIKLDALTNSDSPSLVSAASWVNAG
jgi:general secretion pathway protein A